jgi:hypothetical protein
MQLVEHGLGGGRGLLGLHEVSFGVEEQVVAGEGDVVADGVGVEFVEYLAQALDREQAAACAAVADETDGFGVPLGEVPVDGGLQ